MKPLITEEQDAVALQDLGRASVQIVHDLKNQLNGLKLYATFLRKRMEKSERAEDELETIGKLIAGIERAVADASVLVRFGRPLNLRLQQVDLVKILQTVAGEHEAQFITTLDSLEGEFDLTSLTEAFKGITTGVQHQAANGGADNLTSIHLQKSGFHSSASAVVEWHGLQSALSDDVFRSFAGGGALRLALAAKIIKAHGGEVEQAEDCMRVQLPLRLSFTR